MGVKIYWLSLIIELCISTHGSASHSLHISSSNLLNVNPITCNFGCFLILRFAGKTRETTIDKRSPSLIKYCGAFLIANSVWLPPPSTVDCKYTAPQCSCCPCPWLHGDCHPWPLRKNNSRELYVCIGLFKNNFKKRKSNSSYNRKLHYEIFHMCQEILKILLIWSFEKLVSWNHTCLGWEDAYWAQKVKCLLCKH